VPGRPYAAIALAVVSVSFSAIFISWSTSPFITIALYRLALASLILVPFVLANRASLLALTRKEVLGMMGVGAILATHFTLWIGSLKLEGVSVSVASSVILVTSHPLLVGLLSHFVLRERLNSWMALGIGLGFSGVVVIAFADSTARSASLVGDLLAFLGGVAAGFYFLAGRRLRQRIPLLAYAFVVYVTATGVLLLYTLILRESLVPVGNVPRELVLFLAMAVIPQIGGHTLYNWSLRWVRADREPEPRRGADRIEPAGLGPPPASAGNRGRDRRRARPLGHLPDRDGAGQPDAGDGRHRRGGMRAAAYL